MVTSVAPRGREGGRQGLTHVNYSWTLAQFASLRIRRRAARAREIDEAGAS